MTDLKEELVQQILVRLPVRTLVRLRSVCKSWCSLIKSPRFIHLHMIQQRTIGHEFILVKRYNIHQLGKDLKTLSYFPDFESLEAPPGYEVPHHKFRMLAGHSNGIVCISDCHFHVFLFNPALREIRPLPIISSWRSPRCREHGVGFGFDEASNDYKVVRIVNTDRYCPSASLEVEIYNLSTNLWRKVGTIAGPPSIFYPMGSSIYIKGLVHWSIWGCRRILTFNTTTEVFDEMSIPVDGQIVVKDVSTLALVAYTTDVKEHGWEMNVWVMKEYGMSESWVKLYSVPPPSSYIEHVQLLSFCKKDKLVMVSSKGNLICYDSAADQYSQIRQFEDLGNRNLAAFEIVACHESLFSTYNANCVL